MHSVRAVNHSHSSWMRATQLLQRIVAMEDTRIAGDPNWEGDHFGNGTLNAHAIMGKEETDRSCTHQCFAEATQRELIDDWQTFFFL